MLSDFKLPKWEKKGRIFTREGGSFFKSHAMRVVPYLKKNGVLRLFFSSRCENDMMHPTFVDVNPRNPSEIFYINETPLMSIGKLGTFDDSGITLASIARIQGIDYFYYTGWKRRRYGVPFDLAIGVARMKFDGDIIERIFQGPIISQDVNHPYLAAGPFVIENEKSISMWYCRGTDWKIYEKSTEPIYTVYEAVSEDGVFWKPLSNQPCIDYKFEDEVISAPWVVKRNGFYVMYYPYRQSQTNILKRYRIGVAVSKNGKVWTRMDELVGIDRSAEGWDSEMICYPAYYKYHDKEYLFYSGNAVGKGGFGYAESFY